jgi:hypothetical protein
MVELNVHNIPLVDLIELWDILTPQERALASKRLQLNPQKATINFDNELQELRKELTE